MLSIIGSSTSSRLIETCRLFIVCNTHSRIIYSAYIHRGAKVRGSVFTVASLVLTSGGVTHRLRHIRMCIIM